MRALFQVGPVLLFCLIHCSVRAQDTLSLPGAEKITARYLDAVASRSGSLSRDIDKQTNRYLSRLEREEARVYKKLAKKDSVAAARGLANSKEQYEALRHKLQTATQAVTSRSQRYIPLLDTLGTSLKFFGQYGDLFKKGLATSQQLKTSLSQVNNLEGRLEEADEVQGLIKERRQQLTEQLQRVGLGDALKPFNKEAYYYSVQLSEFRAMLKDPDKAEKKALDLLNRLPAFRNFMQQNSLLASLFGAPGGDAANAGQALGGLQMRSQVQQMIQSQMPAGGSNASSMMQQDIQAAQTQLNTLKDRVSKLGNSGGGSSDTELPDFKPDQQRTKPFWQRMEYGFNLQTAQSTTYFPATTNFALSLGYKLSDKSTIGIGAGYMLGMGTIQHITFSNQGVGFRTFMDVQLKGSLWVTGGGELNYRSAFRSFSILHDLNPWQRSALLGLTKKFKADRKLKGNIQLLYDFLWQQQTPAGEPLVFRVGYSF